MSNIQQLRQLVNQRLASAAEDVFGLVEISIAEYRNEVERSRREIIELKKEIEHLTAVNAALCSFRADEKPISEEISASKEPDQLPTAEEHETSNSDCVLKEEEGGEEEEEEEDVYIISEVDSKSSKDGKLSLCESQSTTQPDGQLFPSITVTLNDDDGPDSSVCGPSRHDMDFAKKNKVCRFCQKTFKKYCALYKHIDEVHVGLKAFKCPQCDKEYCRRDTLIWHMRIHTGEEPGKKKNKKICRICREKFHSDSALYRHMDTSHDWLKGL